MKRKSGQFYDERAAMWLNRTSIKEKRQDRVRWGTRIGEGGQRRTKDKLECRDIGRLVGHDIEDTEEWSLRVRCTSKK